MSGPSLQNVNSLAIWQVLFLLHINQTEIITLLSLGFDEVAFFQFEGLVSVHEGAYMGLDYSLTRSTTI